MSRIFIFYITVSLIILIKNLVCFCRCNYAYNALRNSLQKSEYKNNVKHSVSVKSLILNANIPCPLSFSVDTFTESYWVEQLLQYVLHASGVYRHRLLHAFFWPSSFIKKINIFRIITDKTNNVFLSILFCVIEAFFVYLLGLYLDTSGIGNKILTFVTGWVSSLIGHIQNH